MQNSDSFPHMQTGVALMIFVVLLAIVSVGVYFSSISVEELQYEQIRKTRDSLNRAKQALLDYAVLYIDTNPGEAGFLPCPDISANNPPLPPPSPPEGISDGSCGGKNINTLGKFPWASLDTGVLRSADGGCLWYALSGEYKNVNSATKTDMLNEDTNGAFQVVDADGQLRVGTTPSSRAVAIVIDPAFTLDSQTRTYDVTSLCGMDYDPGHFLEGNGTYDNSVLSGGTLDLDVWIRRDLDSAEQSPPFNDGIAIVTREELWTRISSRNDIDDKLNQLTRALAECIAAYGNNATNGRLPWPAPVDFGGLDYREDSNYDDVNTANLGRFPKTVDDSDAVLGVNAPAGSSDLFTKGICTSPPLGVDITAGEYNMLWKNWKDHYFYVVSSDFQPSAVAGSTACTTAGCIEVNGFQYAGAVLFAGSRMVGKVRDEPVAGDMDTKNSIASYLEVNNPAGNGTGNYTPTGNDIVYCLTYSPPPAPDPFGVVLCS